MPASEDGCEELLLVAEPVVAGCPGEVDDKDGDLTGLAGLVETLFPLAWDGVFPPTEELDGPTKVLDPDETPAGTWTTVVPTATVCVVTLPMLAGQFVTV